MHSRYCCGCIPVARLRAIDSCEFRYPVGTKFKESAGPIIDPPATNQESRNSNRTHPFRIAYFVKHSKQTQSFVCSLNSLTPSCTNALFRHQQSGAPIPHTKLDPQISQRRSTGKPLNTHAGWRPLYLLNVQLTGESLSLHQQRSTSRENWSIQQNLSQMCSSLDLAQNWR